MQFSVPVHVNPPLTRKNLKKLQKELLLKHSTYQCIDTLTDIRVELLLVNDIEVENDISKMEATDKEDLGSENHVNDTSSSIIARKRKRNTEDEVSFEGTRTINTFDSFLLHNVEIGIQNDEGFKIFDPENTSLLLTTHEQIVQKNLSSAPYEEALNNSTEKPETIVEERTKSNRNSRTQKRLVTITKSKIPQLQSFKIPRLTLNPRSREFKMSFDLQFPKLG